MKPALKIISILKNSSPEVKKRLLLIFTALAVLNGGVWIYALFNFEKNPVLFGLITLSYGLGLRHAVDADHIAVIDNTTRKLMQGGKKPVGVGFFFSLGHSTVVFLQSLLVAISASFVKNNLPMFKETGSFIGTIISSIFLLAIGFINLVVLIDIFKLWIKVTGGAKYSETDIHEHLDKRGLIARLLKPFLKAVEDSRNMYFVGLLFGLGFDTASEVGLLSISASSGAGGYAMWDIILLPVAFTAGMCLIDTLDGILMLGAYGWAYVKPIRKLYYNLNITFISVVIALFIGGVEALQVLIRQLKLSGLFFDFVDRIDFGNLGYFIIGVFAASWILSVLIYKIKRYDLLETKNH